VGPGCDVALAHMCVRAHPRVHAVPKRHVEARCGHSGGLLRVVLHGCSAWTLLHCAAHAGHLGAVKLLVEAGSALSMLDNRHRTPLALAREGKHAAVVEYLEAAEAKGFRRADCAALQARTEDETDAASSNAKDDDSEELESEDEVAAGFSVYGPTSPAYSPGPWPEEEDELIGPSPTSPDYCPHSPAHGPYPPGPYSPAYSPTSPAHGEEEEEPGAWLAWPGSPAHGDEEEEASRGAKRMRLVFARGSQAGVL
jgi:Ankyrin repeats (3 copies)